MLSLDAVRVLIEGVDFAGDRTDDAQHDQDIQVKVVTDLCEQHGFYKFISKMVCKQRYHLYYSICINCFLLTCVSVCQTK